MHAAVSKRPDHAASDMDHDKLPAPSMRPWWFFKWDGSQEFANIADFPAERYSPFRPSRVVGQKVTIILERRAAGGAVGDNYIYIGLLIECNVVPGLFPNQILPSVTRRRHPAADGFFRRNDAYTRCVRARAPWQRSPSQTSSSGHNPRKNPPGTGFHHLLQ